MAAVLSAEYTRRPDFARACWERIAKPISPALAAAVADTDHDVNDHDTVSTAGGDDDDGRPYAGGF